MSIRDRVSWSLAVLALTSSGAIFQGCDDSNGKGTGQSGSAGIEVFPTSGLQTTEQPGGQIASFSVVLKAAPTADVSIPISSSDTSEGTVSTASLTFTSTNWASPQQVTITGVDDTDEDGDTNYTIVTGPAVSTDSRYAGVDAADVAVKNIDNDTAGIRTLDTADLKTTEQGGTAKFKVVLNTRPTANVSIGVVSSNTSEVTVAPATVVFTPDNWSAAQEVTLTGVQDEAQDGDIEVTISSAAADSGDARYAGKKFADVKVKNVDDDSAGFEIKPVSGLVTSENGDSDQFTVRLISKPTADVVLPISSATPNEASVNRDKLTFTPDNWASPQTVTVTGVDDGATNDGAKEFTIATGAAQSADARYDGRNPSDVTGINIDNDSAGFTYAGHTSIVVNEDGTTDTFTVRLNFKPTADVTVAISTNKADQASAAPAQLVFTENNWDSPQTVTVSAVDDGTTADGDQDFLVVLAAATSDDPAYQGIDPPDVPGLAEDNDSPALRVRYTPPLAPSERGGTATVSVYLQTAPEQEVVIPVVSSAPGEVSPSPASLVFTPSNYGPQTITLTGQNDEIVDGNAEAIIKIGPPTGDTTYAAFAARELPVINYDNDTPGVARIFDNQRHATSEAGGQYRFWVALRSPPTANVSFTVDTSNRAEGKALTELVTFTPVDWSSPKVILIEGVNDDPAVRDGSKPYNVIFGLTQSSDARYNNLQIEAVGLVNDDDDTPGIRVVLRPDGATRLTTGEGGTNATFAVSLNTRPQYPVTIPFATTDATEGTTLPTSVTIQPEAWNAETVVTVRGADDDIADGDQPYKINVGPSTSDDADYVGQTATAIDVTNVDNDTANLVVHWIGEENPLSTLEGETLNDAVQVKLGTRPQADVTVSVEIVVPGESPQNEVSVEPASVTFTADNWSGERQFKVIGLPDLAQDGTRPYTLRFVPTSTGDARYNLASLAKNVPGENDDADSPGLRVRKLVPAATSSEDGDEVAFTVRLLKAPTGVGATVNVPLSVLETAGYARYEGELINPVDPDFVQSGDPANPTFSNGPLTASLTFTQANWATPQVVTLKGLNDALADKDVKYFVRVGPLDSPDPDYNGRNIPNVEFTNKDNDTAALVVGNYTTNSAGRLEVAEGATSPSISLKLATRPRGNVAVTFPATPVGQGGVAPATITFDTTNWNVNQNIAVAATDDSVDDGDVTFDVALAVTAASDPEYVALSETKTIPVKTLDNDTAGIVVEKNGSPLLTRLQVSETGVGLTTETFQVRLRAQPAAGTTVKVPITVDTAGADEVTLSAGSWNLTDGIEFTPANWNADVTVTLTAQDDVVKDGDVQYTISLGPTTSADPAYSGTAAPSATVLGQTNDTDTTEVAFSPAVLRATDNGRDFHTAETGGGTVVEFGLVLTSQPSASMTLTVSSDTLAEATIIEPADGVITFTTTDWNVPHKFKVKGVDDDIEDGDQTYEVEFTTLSGGDALFAARPALISLKGWNNDNDNGRAAVEITEPSALTLYEDEATSEDFSIVLNSEPLGDVVVTATLVDDATYDAAATLNGDTGSTFLTFTAADWDEPQTITVAGLSDNDNLPDRQIRVEFTVASTGDAIYNALDLSGDTETGYVLNAPRTCRSAKALWTTNPRQAATGPTTIDPDLDPTTLPIEVYCDQATGTGGWTLLSWVRDSNAQGGLLYPGQTGETVCNLNTPGSCPNRGVGVAGGDQLEALLQHSTEFGQGQTTGGGLATPAPFGLLGSYAFAGRYTYPAVNLATLALSDTSSDACTQLAQGTFTGITGTFGAGVSGSTVYLSQGLRSPPSGNDYSLATNAYSWSVGSPAANCGISSAEPVSVLGTWQSQQYGPRTAAAVGAYVVYVR